ncbi:MAG: hypothetical protein AB8G86_27040 [Saprospiraceae bacterium]
MAINPVNLSENAAVIDLGNKTLLPGLIDIHTHITFDLDISQYLNPLEH